MADNTESSNTGLRVYRSYVEHVRGFPESTVQSFLVGDLVQLDTAVSTANHRIQAASSLSTAYLGISGEAASSNQDQTIPVHLALPDAEFKGWVKETIASSLVGALRSFARDSTESIDYLAVNTSGGDLRCQITEIGLSSAHRHLATIGDTNGYVAFRFLNEFTQFGKST